MGQSSCQYYTRKDTQEIDHPTSSTFKHCFSEGKTLVLDYSGLFHSAYSLSELKSRVSQVYPHSVKLYFDRNTDEKHSYVMLTCVNLSKHRVEYISFELCFKKEIQLILSIYASSHSRLKSNEPGLLELSHECPDNKQFKHNIAPLIDWIIEQNDFTETCGRDGDVGKQIYYVIKKIISSKP